MIGERKVVSEDRMRKFWGITLIVLGAWATLMTLTSPIFLLLGGGMIAWGISLLKQKKPRTGGGGEGWDGATHYGSDAPVYRTEDGREINTGSGAWTNDSFGGHYNYVTHERISRDPLGNYYMEEED